MLDESMFEDIHEIAENSAYLKAVEQKDVSLEMLEQLPPYSDCRDIEERLRVEHKLTFEAIFNEATGFYMIKCLTGDHMVLTRSGWRSLKVIHRDFEDARVHGAASPVLEVSSFNQSSSCMEWKRVTHTQRFPAAQQRLFRMQGDGMDVVATEDHRMLTGRLGRGGKLMAGSFGIETVGQLLDGTYRVPASSKAKPSLTQFAYDRTRAVVRCGDNRQPAFKLVIPGLERVCDWWWEKEKDGQLGFLRFFGLWLGNGSLEVRDGAVIVRQPKPEATAWLIDLLDEVFPRCWYCNISTDDDDSSTFHYTIRCPPLYEWLRVMAVGPAGYNPLDPAQLRKYPHFDRNAKLEREEAVSAYGQPTAGSTWTEAEMLAALSAGVVRRPCFKCGDSSGVRLTCSGRRCHEVDGITRVHPDCAGREDATAFDAPWYCPHSQCRKEAAQLSAAHPSAAPPASSRDEPVSDPSPAKRQRVRRRSEPTLLPQRALAAEDEAGAMVAAGKAEVMPSPTRTLYERVSDIDADGHRFYRKRWMGPNVAGTFANLSQPQAVALLEGFCRSDGTYAQVHFKDVVTSTPGQPHRVVNEPTGCWECSSSSFPLIDHLQLIGQLAGARVDLARQSERGKESKGFQGRRKKVVQKPGRWQLTFNFNKTCGAKEVHVARLAKPVPATDVEQRGYYQYEDDGFVYDLTVKDNHNFLTQRLSTKHHRGKRGASEAREDVRAHPVVVGNCVAAGSLVALADGTSVPIEQVQKGMGVLTYHAAVAGGREEGLTVGTVAAVKDQGEKECVELLFSDGRLLVCTHDHLIRTADGRWVQAKDLLVDCDEVAAGVEYPDRTGGAAWATGWSVKDTTDDLGFALDMDQRAPETLAFARLLGYALTDGSASAFHQHRTHLFLGHWLDAAAVLDDIFLLTGAQPEPTRGKRTWDIAVPVSLDQAFARVGVDRGKRTGKVSRFPAFVTDPHCPVPVVREFLGGLFGGDGITLWLAHQGGGRLDGLGFCTTRSGGTATEQKQKLQTELFALLTRVRVDTSRITVHIKTVASNTQTREGYEKLREMQARGEVVAPTVTAETVEADKSYVLLFEFANDLILSFARNVSFRYCCHKQQRLSAGVAYFRSNERAVQQKRKVGARARVLRRSGISLPAAFKQAREELETQEQLLPAVVKWKPTTVRELQQTMKKGDGGTVKAWLTSAHCLAFFSEARTTAPYNAAKQQAVLSAAATAASTEDDDSASAASPAKGRRRVSAPNLPSQLRRGGGDVVVMGVGDERTAEEVVCVHCRLDVREELLLLCDGCDDDDAPAVDEETVSDDEGGSHSAEQKRGEEMAYDGCDGGDDFNADQASAPVPAAPSPFTSAFLSRAPVARHHSVDLDRDRRAELTRLAQVQARPASPSMGDPSPPAGGDISFRLEDAPPAGDVQAMSEGEEGNDGKYEDESNGEGDEEKEGDEKGDFVYPARDKVTYGVHIDARVLPLFRVRLVGRREVGLRHVYDLSVPNPRDEADDTDCSFVVNGVVVHNCFLIADYAVDKAIFIKDVEAYKSMRFESARRKVAALLYQRFVSTDEQQHVEYKHGMSVFQIIQQSKGAEEKKERDGKVQPASINLSSSPSHAQSLELKTIIPPSSPLHSTNAASLTHPTAISTTTTVVNGHLVTLTQNNGVGLSPHVNGHLSTPHPHPQSVASSTMLSQSTYPITPSSPSHAASTLLQMGTANNSIGVYGKSVRVVREKVQRGEAPKDLFDEVARDVMTDLKLDAFPRFKQGDFYKRYIRTKWIETQKVQVKDFTTFRVLGRGGFGAVHACRKKNSGQIYAMKCVNKKLVKVKSALDNVLEERNVLTMMKSHFVTNLKYGLQDEDTLYLIMDLMLGGDLKFHLINAGRFTEKRARFYAAQVLLGLEHVHKLSIIYRDMKLENVLLDHQGHCRLSDLGLAVVTKVKIKGYAGTPGYCFTAADHELLTAGGFMNLDQVIAHFRSQAELQVACWVDGAQEFHAITADKVTVAEETLDLVTFSSAAHAVSLRVTAGHRMFGRLGAVTEEADGSLPWVEEDVPALRDVTARQVVASGHGSTPTVFEVRTSFPLGSAAVGVVDVWQLPFVKALGLVTEDHIAAFLWLYGYWLGDGWLEGGNARIAFGPIKPQDWDALDAVLARLPLPKLQNIKRGALGYWRAANLTKGGQRNYYICAEAWWQYFGEEYGHKYAGKYAAEAARAGAMRRGIGIPVGRHLPAVPAGDVPARAVTPLPSPRTALGRHRGDAPAASAAGAPSFRPPLADITCRTCEQVFAASTYSMRANQRQAVKQHEGECAAYAAAHASSSPAAADKPSRAGCGYRGECKCEWAADMEPVKPVRGRTAAKPTVKCPQCPAHVADTPSSRRQHQAVCKGWAARAAPAPAAQPADEQPDSAADRDAAMASLPPGLQQLALAAEAAEAARARAGKEPHKVIARSAHIVRGIGDYEPLTAQHRVDVVYQLHGPKHDNFGAYEDGVLQSAAFAFMEEAMRVAGVDYSAATASTAIYELLPIVWEDWADAELRAAIADGGDYVPVAQACVRAVLSSDAKAVIAFGEHAQRRYRALGTASVARTGPLQYYKVSCDGRSLYVVEAPQPSSGFGATIGVVAAAMALAQQLAAVGDGRTAADDDKVRLLATTAVEAPDAEGITSAKWYWYWVWRLSPSDLRTVLAGQRFADGTEAEQAVHGGALYTSSVRHRDEVVRLCLAAGYSAFYQMDKAAGTVAGVNKRGKPIILQHDSWCVCYTESAQQVEPKLRVRRDARLEEAVACKVWCVTVPAKGNLIMVRRVLAHGAAGQPSAVSRPLVIGNTAPEMIKNKLYGPAADIFSYGVMLYRMLCGSKPFKGKVDRDLDKAVIERKPTFPKEIFSKEAISLLTGLLQKRPENRLGCGERGIEEVKEHPFFESIDWGLLEAGYIDPPFVPNKFDVNAASLKDIGDFDRAKYKHVKLDERFKQRIKNFEYVNTAALQEEMVQVLEKADESINFEKFAQQQPPVQQPQPTNGPACCTLA